MQKRSCSIPGGRGDHKSNWKYSDNFSKNKTQMFHCSLLAINISVYIGLEKALNFELCLEKGLFLLLP